MDKTQEIKQILSKFNFDYFKFDSERIIDNVYGLFVNNIIFEPSCDVEMCYLGIYHFINKNNDEMLQYYLMATEFGNVEAMCILGYYYDVTNDHKNMKQYYLMAIAKNDDIAMNNLAYYYRENKKYDKMLKYLLMAINNGCVLSMYNLGFHYGTNKNYGKMVEYYLMAIEHGHEDALYNLYDYYKNNNCFKQMKMLAHIILNTGKIVTLPLYLNDLYILEVYLNNQHIYSKDDIIRKICHIHNHVLNIKDQNKFLMILKNINFDDFIGCYINPSLSLIINLIKQFE